MSDLRDLYQEVILDHSKRPRNYRGQEGASGCARGHNPLCGDRVTVYVALKDGVIEDVSFEGAGCAICTASASMMTQALKGKPLAEAEALYERFHHLLTVGENGDAPAPSTESPPPSTQHPAPDLGKLKVFAGVREYPIRVKCATLPWHTFHAALHSQDETVTTE